MTSITVEPVTASTASSAHELINEYYEALQIQARDPESTTALYWTSSVCITLLCNVDALPAGIVILRPLTDFEDVYECKRLYVRPGYRGLGIAGKLMDHAEDWARAKSVKEVYLDSHDGLKAALAFYRKRGYVDIARYNDNPQVSLFLC